MRCRSGGQILVDALVRQGVSVLWGIPGTHNLDIYEHLATSGIRHVLPRHEQGAAFAADGYARVTGRPGVCITTSGPAVLNAATALAQSYSDSVPVLLVSAGMPVRHPGRGNGHLHETKDLTAAMNGIVAYSHRVTSVEEIEPAVAEAFATMTSGRARPVHIEVPFDVLAQHGHTAPVPVAAPAGLQADAAAITGAVDRIVGAATPLIIAGGGCRNAGSQLAALAQRLDAPVVCSMNGKGALPEDHVLSMGAGLHRAPVRGLVEDSDIVIVVGSELSPADLWEGPLPLDGKVVRIDVDPHQAFANAVPCAVVIGDAATVLDDILVALGPRQSRAAGDADRVTQWRKLFDDDASAVAAPWRWIIDSAAEALGRDGILVGDSTKVCYFGAVAAFPAYGSGRFLYPTGYGTLGYGLPAAVGAKVGMPDSRVLALIGDGGIMFTLSELAAAAQLRIGLPIIVVDNGGYGEIRDEMRAREQHPLAVDIPAPDFVAAASALGCHAISVDSKSVLDDVLAAAFVADRPTLVHIRAA